MYHCYRIYSYIFLSVVLFIYSDVIPKTPKSIFETCIFVLNVIKCPELSPN